MSHLLRVHCDQTAINIRERAGGRKQKPVRRPESRSKRLRYLFGIWGRQELPRGLEGRYRLAHPNEKTATSEAGGWPCMESESEVPRQSIHDAVVVTGEIGQGDSHFEPIRTMYRDALEVRIQSGEEAALKVRFDER